MKSFKLALYDSTLTNGEEINFLGTWMSKY